MKSFFSSLSAGLGFISLFLIVTTICTEDVRYDPTWESLDSRPLPSWYDEGKIGIFVHWGVFSVPGFGNEWFWYNWKHGNLRTIFFMLKNYPPKFTYQELGPMFTCEFFDPTSWAKLFKKSGAKYVVLTTKHHEGYTLWPSKYSFSWNAMDVGPKRDLVGDLAKAIRKEKDLHFGLYHSMLEFYNPLYLSDKANKFTTDEFVQKKTMPELYEIVKAYKPEVLWSDGEWEADDKYWKSKEFLAWLYNDSPVKSTVLVNDRWGNNTRCKHGGFFNCDDKYDPGVLPPFKWENCMSLDKYSWGNRRDAILTDYLTPQELIQVLVRTVSCGGNLLVNVGPTKDGMISPIQEERLLQLGKWLEINGKGIYETKPWTVQKDSSTSDIWYTSNTEQNHVYAITLKWPGQKPLQLGSVNGTAVESVQLLGYESDLKWTSDDSGILVTFPPIDQVNSKWAWTLVITETQKDEQSDDEKTENEENSPEIDNHIEK